jgi:hypothetical protein
MASPPLAPTGQPGTPLRESLSRPYCGVSELPKATADFVLDRMRDPSGGAWALLIRSAVPAGAVSADPAGKSQTCALASAPVDGERGIVAASPFARASGPTSAVLPSHGPSAVMTAFTGGCPHGTARPSAAAEVARISQAMCLGMMSPENRTRCPSSRADGSPRATTSCERTDRGRRITPVWPTSRRRCAHAAVPALRGCQARCRGLRLA